ncbi:MAG: ComEC/Rec2 family competence protein [Nitrospirota bacterium]
MIPDKYKQGVVVGLLFCVIALCFLFVQLPDDRFHIYFLDVGQGDATFVKTPFGHKILIDGGPNNYVIEELGKVLPFFDKTIDLVVLTHPHADHIDGLVEVLKRFDVENVVMTGVYCGDSTYLEFLRVLEEQGVRVFFAESGMGFLFGDVEVGVLYPAESFFGKSFENINNSSLVVKVSYGDENILFTGDLEMEGESELAESGLLDNVDVYQVGHHGSKTASSLPFLAKISPEIAVISCGKDNKFNHPHVEALENLEMAGVEEVYRTDLEGTVEFVY